MKAEKQETNKLWAKLESKSKNKDQFPDYDLYQQSCIVGRDEKTCDVWIESQLVSANHAKILLTDKQKAVLQDTSSNGTFINGVKAPKFTETDIKQGDTITFVRNQLKPEENIEYVFHFVEQQSKKQDADIGKAPSENQLDDDYQCTLCQEVIYQCVTLNPCKHNFCGACMTEWIKNKAFDCPNCKRTAVSLEKNQVANNIIKRFLEKNPEFQRDRQEYDRLNQSNFLTSDSLNLVQLGATQNQGRKTRQQQPDSDVSFDSNDVPSEDQSEKRDDASPPPKGPKGSPARPGKIDIEPPSNRLVLAQPNVEPPQKGAKSGVDLCFGCKTGLDDEIDPDLECLICQKRYCSRGAVGSKENECRQARKPRTKLVLMGLGEHEVPETITEDVCRDNKFEWDALIKYNRSHGATTQTIWEQAQNMFQHGAFTLKLTKELHSNSGLNKELKLDMKSSVCGSCFDSLVWFQIVFNYRQGIRKDMPESIRNRPHCYFGINCRTMAHNDDHAKKLDHYIEQKRF